MEKIILSNKAPLLDATCEILKIKSVKSKPLPGMPFGEGPTRALEYVLNLANSFGLRTRNLDYYCGWAEWGEGAEMIGIPVHLDVVPEGSGWTFPPYGGEIHDGKIYSRGASDDKGPAMAALFALKNLKDAGIKLNKRVRVIFGTDEESGSKCMEYYKEHDEAPTMGFSPDAKYPIINGEKGILTYTFKAPFVFQEEESGVKIESLHGGHRHNMVPDYAVAYLKGVQDEIKHEFEYCTTKMPSNFEIQYDKDLVVIKSYGISAHGSTPEKGKNAVMLLTKLLGEMEIIKSQRDFINFLNEKIGLDTTGKGLGVDFSDELSGHLTFNVGVARFDRDDAAVTVNIRYPIKYTAEEILNQIRRNTPSYIEIEDISDSKPHYVSEDNLMIQKLKEAYEKVIGEKAYCFSIGGGTYARMFKNCVAFGPTFPGKPDLAHEKDEYIEVADLMNNLRIYTYVLEELAK